MSNYERNSFQNQDEWWQSLMEMIYNGRQFKLSWTMLKYGKHTLQILLCEHCNIYETCLTIFQPYAWKGSWRI